MPAEGESKSNQSSEKLDKDGASLGFANDALDDSVNEAAVDPDEMHKVQIQEKAPA